MEPLDLIKAIRESFGASITVYTMGNCYQFYEILKSVFPQAKAYYSGHVFTEIDGRFYDIKGEHYLDKSKLKDLSTDKEHIKNLSGNKWTDEKREKLKEAILNKESTKGFFNQSN